MEVSRRDGGFSGGRRFPGGTEVPGRDGRCEHGGANIPRMRRLLIAATLLASATLATDAQTKAAKTAATPASKSFTVVEATIPEMRHGDGAGTRHLAADRPAVPDAHRDLRGSAARGDYGESESARRSPTSAIVSVRQGKIRGPLHGIPIALKDNIHTTDMRTTGGALAFEGLVPPYEATLTKNLRDAGAIIIAKTGMTELANWVAGAPTPMPGNYNGLAGYGYNPYDPRRDPREATFDGRPALGTGGSSSGVGTAANFWAGNVGTETSGSMLSPSNQNMLAGIKPTVGRISRYGVIPITADQDTAGPMAKSVTDVAIMLGVARERGARSERSRDADLHAAARPRLHEVPQSRRPDRARASAFRAPSSTIASTPPRRRPRARGRAERRAEESDGRGDRHPEDSRARSSSIRPTSRASSTRIRRTTSCCGTRARGANERTRQGRELLGRLQVRDEARLQQVARHRSAPRRR